MGAELQLSDLFHIFVNREQELSWLGNIVNARTNQNRINIVKASIDSGLTSALQKTIEKQYLPENVIYFNARDSRPEALFEQSVDAVIKKGEAYANEILVPLARSDRKNSLTRLIKESLKIIPIAGAPISGIFDLASDWFLAKPDTGGYNGKIQKLFEAISKTGQTIILADHFHDARDHHIKQLTNILYGIEDIRLVVAQNTQGKSLSKQVTNQNWSIFSSSISEFPDPDAALGRKIIEFINQKHDIHLSESFSESIHLGLGAFLRTLLNAVSATGGHHFQIRQIHRDILSFMRCADEPLPFSLLLECLTTSALFLPDSIALKREITFLHSANLISLQNDIGGIRMVLTRRGETVADEALSKVTQRLFYSSSLYRTVERGIAEGRINRNAVALLMYRLSKFVDERSARRWSMAMVRSCVTTSNFFEAESVLRQIKAKLSVDYEGDALSLISACISTKRYQDALAYIQERPSRSIKLKILESILLYRCLRFDEAFEVMKELQLVDAAPNDACMLAIYFIGLCIDLQKPEELGSQLDEWISTYCDTKLHGYLLNIVEKLEIKS